jgi:mannose-6-phosphate isomerase-like protein (cupin superfamily)
VTELGPRDLVRTPAGQAHCIRNPGAGAATLWTVIGSSEDDAITYEGA